MAAGSKGRWAPWRGCCPGFGGKRGWSRLSAGDRRSWRWPSPSLVQYYQVASSQALPCLSKAQLALPGLGFKAASWRQIRSHQLPFLTRWLDGQASLTSTWRSLRPHPAQPGPPASAGRLPSAQSRAWPPASPKIPANWGIVFTTLNGAEQEASCCPSLPRAAPDSGSAEGPGQDVTEVLCPPQRGAGLGVREPTASFPCTPRSHGAGHSDDPQGFPCDGKERG